MKRNQYVMPLKRVFSLIHQPKWMATALLSTVTVASMIAPPSAMALHPHSDYGRSPYHQLVKPALIGAGIGAAIGGLTGNGDTGGRLIKGALIGGAAGAGYGYLRQKGYLNRFGLSQSNPYGYSNLRVPQRYTGYPYAGYNPYYY